MNYKILSVVTLLIAVIPTVVLAQTPTGFIPLVGVPGLEANNTNIGTYINALYTLSISIAALLAVIKIIIAGVKYMLSDVVTSKADAKSDIQGALVGLLIVISAVVILETINPQLRVFRLIMAPASQPSARTVQTAPTETGQAPLPGVARSESDVVTQCTSPEVCLQAANTCYASAPNANIRQEGTSSGSQVTCYYGTTRNITCDTRSRGGTRDCNIYMRARCPSSSTYTETSATSATCFTPNPVRPEALPQSNGA